MFYFQRGSGEIGPEPRSVARPGPGEMQARRHALTAALSWVIGRVRETPQSDPPYFMSRVLSVTELRKSYGATVAVDGVSFEVASNEIVGLLGPNGAGKTTTINMILGVLEPTSGSIRIEEIVDLGRSARVRSNTPTSQPFTLRCPVT